MTIAIVIGTHGWAAEQLLKTAEMLLGEQENVGWIDFVPGENAETLIEKYNAQLAKLDTTKEYNGDYHSSNCAGIYRSLYRRYGINPR